MKRVIASNQDLILDHAKSIVESCLGELGISVESFSTGRDSRVTVDSVSYNGHTYTSKGWPSDIYAHLHSRPFNAATIDSIQDYEKTSSYIGIVSTVFLYEIYGYSDNVSTLQSWATQALQNISADSDGIQIDGSFDGGSVYMTGSEYTGVYSEDRIGYLTLFPKYIDVYISEEYNETLTERISGNFSLEITVADAIDFLNGRFDYSDIAVMVQEEVDKWSSKIPDLLSESKEQEDRNALAQRNFNTISDYLESRLSEFDFRCENYNWHQLNGSYVLLGEKYEVCTEVDFYMPEDEFESEMPRCYRRLRKSILRRKRNLAKNAFDSAML